MGAQSTVAALTETRGGPSLAGNRLDVGIDVGRHEHVVAAIPRERMENGSWERAAVRRVSTSGRGFRLLTEWLRPSPVVRPVHADLVSRCGMAGAVHRAALSTALPGLRGRTGWRW
jgi:hypothetical protein